MLVKQSRTEVKLPLDAVDGEEMEMQMVEVNECAPPSLQPRLRTREFSTQTLGGI